jgi:hypothetical protein
MLEIHNDFTRSKLEILRRMNARRDLPSGIHISADGAVLVKVEELQVGIKPVVINHPSGVMRVNEYGAFFESNDGDIYAHWRDGPVETNLVNVQQVVYAKDVKLERHTQIQLSHGTEYRWDFLPHGSLRMIYDTAGILDEVVMRGIMTHQTKDGTLTVVQIASSNKVVK